METNLRLYSTSHCFSRSIYSVLVRISLLPSAPSRRAAHPFLSLSPCACRSRSCVEIIASNPFHSSAPNLPSLIPDRLTSSSSIIIDTQTTGRTHSYRSHFADRSLDHHKNVIPPGPHCWYLFVRPHLSINDTAMPCTNRPTFQYRSSSRALISTRLNDDHSTYFITSSFRI